MLGFYEVNFEVKLWQNIGQICETIKSKACPATMKAAYSKDVSSRVNFSFTILTQYQNKYCLSKVWYKNYKKQKTKKKHAHLWCE